ncbi:MAG TPA: hypothetical protein VGA08_02585 [Candidatus Saccharimonadales bacterium]
MAGGNDNFQPESDGSDDFYAHSESHANAPVGETQQSNLDKSGGVVQIAPDAAEDKVVTWEASEYIHHQKSSSWFLILAGGTLVVSAALYLLIKDIFSVIVLILMAVALAVFGARRPEVRRYSLSQNGLSIGDRDFALDDFRSYSVMQEGALLSITFQPIKRFMIPVTIYFSPQDAGSIGSILESMLPHEDHGPDLVDRLMRIIRF